MIIMTSNDSNEHNNNDTTTTTTNNDNVNNYDNGAPGPWARLWRISSVPPFRPDGVVLSELLFSVVALFLLLS